MRDIGIQLEEIEDFFCAAFNKGFNRCVVEHRDKMDSMLEFMKTYELEHDRG